MTNTVIHFYLQNTSSVEAYFPKGVWYDAVTGEMNQISGEKITLNIPLVYIYLSVRGGAILPAQNPELTTTATYVILFHI